MKHDLDAQAAIVQARGRARVAGVIGVGVGIAAMLVGTLTDPQQAALAVGGFALAITAVIVALLLRHRARPACSACAEPMRRDLIGVPREERTPDDQAIADRSPSDRTDDEELYYWGAGGIQRRNSPSRVQVLRRIARELFVCDGCRRFCRGADRVHAQIEGESRLDPRTEF